MANLVPEPAFFDQDAGHSLHSSLRASILEHLFLGELLRYLWHAGERCIHVLRAEVDAGGYDLVIECKGHVRFIQLKSSRHQAKTTRVDVNTAIQDKVGGCVIWMRLDQEMRFQDFLWFGGGPGETMDSLGNQVGRHTRRNKDRGRNLRPAMRVLPKRRFTPIHSVSALAGMLFE